MLRYNLIASHGTNKTIMVRTKKLWLEQRNYGMNKKLWHEQKNCGTNKKTIERTKILWHEQKTMT